jgi:hemolysin activation/secretion protein
MMCSMPHRTFPSCVFVFCLFSFGILRQPALAQTLEKGETAIVTADEAQIFRGKDVVGTVKKGQELAVVDENLAWLGVEWTAEDGQRKSGWIQKSQVDLKFKRRAVTVTSPEAQVFRGQELVATVKRGQRLVVLEENVEWFGVQWMTPEGELKTGWVRKELVGAKPEKMAAIVNVDGTQVVRGTTVVDTLRKGQAVSVLQKRDEWVGVEWTTPAGELKSGWLKADQIIAKPVGEEVLVNVDEAQVLRGSTVVGTVKKGEKLLAIQKNNEWLGVEWTTREGEARSGWIKESQIAYRAMPERVTEAVAPPTPAEEAILVRSLRLEGNSLISTEMLRTHFPALARITPPGVRVPLAEIRKGLEAILNAYHQAGYRAVAVYIPQENIASAAPLAFKDDELAVKIVEGHVASSTVNYEVLRKWRPWRREKQRGPVREDIVEDRLEKLNPIEPGDVLEQEKLERFVQFLERHPGRSAAAVVKKSKEAVGAEEVGRDVDLEIRVVDPEPTAFYFQVANIGSESTEEYRFRAGFIHNNLYGRDDIFSLDFSAPFEQMDSNYAIVGSYDTPLWSPILRLRAFGAYNEFKTTDILGPDTPFLGKGYMLGEELRYTLFHVNSWLFDVFQALEFQSSNLELKSSLLDELQLDETISDVELLDVALGFRLEHLQGPWRPYVQVKAAYNLSDTLFGLSDRSDFEKSRLDTEPGYLNLTLSGHHSLEIRDWLSMSQRVGAGYSPDRLIAAKEFAIGGIHSVRGYEESEVLGDRGLFVSTEPLVSLNALLTPKTGKDLPFRLDFVPAFLDIGTVDVQDSLLGEEGSTTICGVGTGAQLSFKNLLSGRLYWGYALRDANPGGTEEGDDRLHLDLSLQVRF